MSVAISVTNERQRQHGTDIYLNGNLYALGTLVVFPTNSIAEKKAVHIALVSIYSISGQKVWSIYMYEATRVGLVNVGTGSP